MYHLTINEAGTSPGWQAENKMSQSYIIAGIGTDIGKTIVSAVLCEAWKADYWKPVQAGSLEFTDTDLVKSLVSNPVTRFFPEAYRLSQPMSPHAASEMDKVIISEQKLTIPVTENRLLIELAGGLMVPLRNNFLNIDLLQQWNLPVILVSRNYLGSINHTLLSMDALKSRNIPVEGIVFNDSEVKTTERVILSYTQLKCLGRIPKLITVDKHAVTVAAKSFILPD